MLGDDQRAISFDPDATNTLTQSFAARGMTLSDPVNLYVATCGQLTDVPNAAGDAFQI